MGAIGAVRHTGATGAAGAAGAPTLPKAPPTPTPEPIPADRLTRRIDEFLASRGIASTGQADRASAAGDRTSAPVHRTSAPAAPVHGTAPIAPIAPVHDAVPFVCEDDVRAAIKAGQKIRVSEKTIITPAARDAGEAANVFVWPSYRS